MTPFGVTHGGQEVQKVTLSAGDLTVSLLTWGAVLQDVRLRGIDHSLTLGSDRLRDYEGEMRHHGSLIGPIANRISTARIRLDGMMYELERNQDGRIHLHSGAQGTLLLGWDIAEVSDSHATLNLHLPDGMCGLPGNREISVTFTVSAPATLTMTINGTTDAKTCMNFANHSYWALDEGVGFGGHTLTIPAGRILEANDAMMPTGRILHVEGTPYDARNGLVLTGDAQQFFDLNYCFNDGPRALHEVARLRGTSGLEMRTETTAPGLQVYDCSTIDGAGFETHHGPSYGYYSGLALEAQHWPGAANHAGFPRIEYAARERYHQLTRWSFYR